MGFGQTDHPDHWPSVHDELERRPLVALGDDTWFAGLFTKLPWAIAPVIEGALRETVDWERYQAHRSRYLERRAVDLIAGSNPHVRRCTRLKYGDDKSGRPDLDGLVLVGGTALLVEAKAGRLGTASRRGAPRGMREDLHELLSDPQQQLNRAAEYILGQPEALFDTTDGPVTLRRSELHRIVHVIVTADSLTAFVTRLPRLASIGVFDRRSLPWAASEASLRDLGGFPSYVGCFGAGITTRQIGGSPRRRGVTR